MNRSDDGSMIGRWVDGFFLTPPSPRSFPVMVCACVCVLCCSWFWCAPSRFARVVIVVVVVKRGFVYLEALWVFAYFLSQIIYRCDAPLIGIGYAIRRRGGGGVYTQGCHLSDDTPTAGLPRQKMFHSRKGPCMHDYGGVVIIYYLIYTRHAFPCFEKKKFSLLGVFFFFSFFIHLISFFTFVSRCFLVL